MGLRVAIVSACPYPVPQGSQVLLKDTALALRDHGYDVHLVVYGYGEGADEHGLNIHRTIHVTGTGRTKAGPSLAKPMLDLMLVGTLRRVIREQHIDVVQAHNYEGLLVALAAGAHPLVYQAHNAMADELPHYAGFKTVGRVLGAWLDRTFPKRAEQVVAPHAGLAEYLIACGCRPARVSVLAPPAKTDWFEPESVSDALPPMVYTGNLDAYQNIEFLRHVHDRVRASIPEARLILATNDHPNFPEAEFVPTPDFDSVRAVLSRDAVVVCPRVSWSGYPIKVLNAMAAGKPVVVCRSAAHAVLHERTGIVVEDNDEAGFAEAVVRLMRDGPLRGRMGFEGRQEVDARHAPDNFARGLEGVFERAMRRR